MHVRVVELMVAGVRRPREACLADPGITGTLSIGDIPVGTAEKRKRPPPTVYAARCFSGSDGL